MVYFESSELPVPGSGLCPTQKIPVTPQSPLWPSVANNGFHAMYTDSTASETLRGQIIHYCETVFTTNACRRFSC